MSRLVGQKKRRESQATDAPRPRRLAVLITGFNAGGAQKQCAYLLNALAETGRFDIYVLYCIPGPNLGLLNPSIRLEQLSVKSLYSLEPVFQANHRFREFQPDILFTWLHAADVYGFILKLLNPHWKWVMTERDSNYPREFRYILRRAVGRFSDMIIANSEKGCRLWRMRFVQPPVFQALNIVPQGVISSRRPTDIRRIAYIGRLEIQKNVEILCKAFISLAKANPSLEFSFVGSGSLENTLARAVIDSGCEGRIRLLGYRHDIPEILRNTDLLVSMSHHEGTPNVILEAVHAGVGIVASRIPEHEAILGCEFPLLVAERNSWEAIASGIRSAIAAPTSAHSQHAIQQVSKMQPEKVRREYEELFESCLSK